jgi:hypothetical protein
MFPSSLRVVSKQESLRLQRAAYARLGPRVSIRLTLSLAFAMGTLVGPEKGVVIMVVVNAYKIRVVPEAVPSGRAAVMTQSAVAASAAAEAAARDRVLWLVWLGARCPEPGKPPRRRAAPTASRDMVRNRESEIGMLPPPGYVLSVHDRAQRIP